MALIQPVGVGRRLNATEVAQTIGAAKRAHREREETRKRQLQAAESRQDAEKYLREQREVKCATSLRDKLMMFTR